MYKSLAIIESKDLTFNPKTTTEFITVKGMSEDEWEIYSSDPDFYWDIKHPFMFGELFYSREEYNRRLEEYCKKNSDFLTKFIFVEN